MARDTRIPEDEAPFPVPAGSIVTTSTPDVGGEQVIVHFGNGRGASVVRHRYSYGGESGLWELAVLKYDELDYTTEITSDVLGWLSKDDVADLLVRIHALPHVSST